MSEYLSGAFSGLEDRVSLLETQVVQFPSTNEFNSLSAIGTSRYNTVNTSMTSVLGKLASMETYIVNLKLYVLNLERSYTGHTGSYLSGSNPAHYGI